MLAQDLPPHQRQHGHEQNGKLDLDTLLPNHFTPALAAALGSMALRALVAQRRMVLLSSVRLL
jgi:hypothetical protein